MDTPTQTQEQITHPLEPVSNCLTAGGIDPNKFNPVEAWYPVSYLADLEVSKPTPFTLLGENLVIWWDTSQQTWRVFSDQCPHRLAALSEGRINEEGLLECPYHGWTFNGKGNCTFIPQQIPGGTAETSQRAGVKAYPTRVCQGLLFVYPGQVENANQVPVPMIEALEDNSGEWVCIDTFRDLPYDALTLLENVLDSSHLPYTHHRSVGNRVNASPVELEVRSSGKQGFLGFWQEGPRKGKLGSQETQFVAPGLMWHDLTSKQFGRTLTVVYATPIRKGECRLFARFPFKFPSKLPGLVFKLTPRWYSHLNQNAILEDDQIFLHYQERYLEQAGGSDNFAKAFYLPTRADYFVSELRKWVNQYQAEPFPHQTLPPALSKDKLLDRYYSHTVHCGSCRAALANLKRVRMGIAIATFIFLTLTPLLSWIATGISLSLGIIWLGLGRLERQFYYGRETPPRNLPETKNRKSS